MNFPNGLSGIYWNLGEVGGVDMGGGIDVLMGWHFWPLEVDKITKISCVRKGIKIVWENKKKD